MYYPVYATTTTPLNVLMETTTEKLWRSRSMPSIFYSHADRHPKAFGVTVWGEFRDDLDQPEDRRQMREIIQSSIPGSTLSNIFVAMKLGRQHSQKGLGEFAHIDLQDFH